MSDTNPPFRLVNYRRQDDGDDTARVGLVFDERILPLDALSSNPASRTLLRAAGSSPLAPGLQGLLVNWERSVSLLRELADSVRRDGVEGEP
ncbi:MAG: hypothetical protein JOZ41_10795, partial [Chloroflexi bacterium]|nr:hypothetical protein [Chloroflexota bacterium]